MKEKSIIYNMPSDPEYQFKLYSKYDREHDFDVIPAYVVACRKPRWICRKHSNYVVRQVKTPGKSIIFVAQQLFCCTTDFHVVRRLDYTMTVMYQSIPSVTTPPGNPQPNFQKSSNPGPRANFLCQIPGGRSSRGPFISINCTLFYHFQDLNH